MSNIYAHFYVKGCEKLELEQQLLKSLGWPWQPHTTRRLRRPCLRRILALQGEGFIAGFRVLTRELVDSPYSSGEVTKL